MTLGSYLLQEVQLRVSIRESRTVTHVGLFPSTEEMNDVWSPGMPVCSCIKEFHNSPGWSIAKVYLLGNKLTVWVVIYSPLCML